MDKEQHEKISCPVFQKQETAIKDITDKINKTERVQEKVRFAQELQKEVDVLLSCPDYKSESLDCESCRFLGELRKRTAELIIKAKKLA
ncbi:MAG: hypothetical protein KKH29_00320 [Candidatus Omnitrophica bacterium]|nr:hypothetical protein [Candidatus Omnitrophota bacterium]MBU4472760.1 hypothetical protein [Candidatus Omnitrophota bacterium]